MTRAWLIETGTIPVYLSRGCAGGYAWTPNANRAIRFESHEVAERTWRGVYIPGSEKPCVRIAEHQWNDENEAKQD